MHTLFALERCPTLGAPFATRCFSREYKTHAPRTTPRATINSLSLGTSPRRIYKAPDEEIHAHAKWTGERLTPRWGGSRSPVRVTGLHTRALRVTAAQRRYCEGCSSQFCLFLPFLLGRNGTNTGFVGIRKHSRSHRDTRTRTLSYLVHHSLVHAWHRSPQNSQLLSLPLSRNLDRSSVASGSNGIGFSLLSNTQEGFSHATYSLSLSGPGESERRRSLRAARRGPSRF